MSILFSTYSPILGEKVSTFKVDTYSPDIGEYVHTLNSSTVPAEMRSGLKCILILLY